MSEQPILKKLKPDNSLRMLVARSIFDDRPVDKIMPLAGKRITEVMAALRAQGMIERALVTEDGWPVGGWDLRVWISTASLGRPQVEIPRDHWHAVRVKPGMSLAVAVKPMKGGGGGKSPLKTLLSIAIIAAGMYASGLASEWALRSVADGGLGFGGLGSKLLGGLAGGAVTACGTITVGMMEAPKP